MPNLAQLVKINETVKEYDAQLVAVTKTRSLEAIQEIYDAGHTVYGENRVQELREKQPALPDDVQWHAIGHLQSNKVKYIAPYIQLIHSVESYDLLSEINKRAKQSERCIDVLLQMHIAQESSKFGLDEEQLSEVILSARTADLKNIRICGVMGMATFTNDEKQVRKEFQSLRKIFDRTKQKHFPDEEHFREISMGMSGDYQIALDEGSTIIRVGSLLFA